MAMATIGLLVIAFVVFETWDEVTRGSTGIFGMPRQTTIWWALAFAVLRDRRSRGCSASPTGPEAARQPRATALAAEALGVDVVRLRLGGVGAVAAR